MQGFRDVSQRDLLVQVAVDVLDRALNMIVLRDAGRRCIVLFMTEQGYAQRLDHMQRQFVLSDDVRIMQAIQGRGQQLIFHTVGRAEIGDPVIGQQRRFFHE